MALPANGYVEVNGSGVFRGHLLAATGTFSGVFESDVVDVVDYINVRDGAIMAYVFCAPSLVVGTPDYYVQGTLPAYPGHYSMVSLRIPLKTWNAGGYWTKIYIERNGVLIFQDLWLNQTGWTVYPGGVPPVIQQAGLEMQYFEFIDIPILSVPTTYKVYFEPNIVNDLSTGPKRTIAVGGDTNSYEAMLGGSTPVPNSMFGYRRL